jgi:hypothetical protein
VKKSAKQKNSNKGPIPPKCSQETADAIHACDDDEILGPCCYAAGSGAKVEWLRERQARFGEHLVPIPIAMSKRQKKIAKRRRRGENLRTADEMDQVLWGSGLDNPATIPRPAQIKGHAETVRTIITKLHAPE